MDEKTNQNLTNEIRRRIGIIGGSFNPVHYGHLMIAENAREQFALDKVLFIPTGHSPLKHKQQITDAVHRCAMVSMAVSDNPWFDLDEVEVQSPEISYTYRTMNKLKDKYISSEFFFILGADSLFDFESWKNPQLILENCSILAAGRRHLREKKFLEQIAYLNEKYPQKFHPLDTTNIDVSSEEIRQRVRQGRSIRYLVPETVEKYIKDKKLYLE